MADSRTLPEDHDAQRKLEQRSLRNVRALLDRLEQEAGQEQPCAGQRFLPENPLAEAYGVVEALDLGVRGGEHVEMVGVLPLRQVAGVRRGLDGPFAIAPPWVCARGPDPGAV